LSVSVGALRSFLLAMPKPHTVRVSNGETSDEIKIGKQKFVRVAETILAMGAESIELLDKDGSIIRAKRLDDTESRRSDAAAVPEVIATDPSAAMLTHFANLIHRAYEHATEVSFVKLVELVDRIDARSDSIEARLERTEGKLQAALRDQLDMEYERAQELAEKAKEGDQDALSTMAQAFLQGQMHQPPNGKA